MANKIKLKRGLAANVGSLTLESGELAVVLDSNKLKFGDANGVVKDIETVSADSAKKTVGALTITQNGNSIGSFDGSSNKTLDVTAETALATFEIREDGNLYAIGNDVSDINAYSINEDGDLILTLNQVEKNLGHVIGDGAAVTPDLSDYATKEYVDNAIPSLENYATKTYVDNAIPNLNNYATKTYVDNAIPNLDNYATKEYVNTALNNLSFVTLTKTEYNALATKDANTLYIIKEG